ncbi:AbiV family abortive infection protein [Paracoccus zhejiangensis]|uniref:Uncharacterized protein n=1 Tax=Paracoccus zhejiangensis TaxID=1077935 RepID=A0A2H5F0T1_9RHOB|nr:AbiV family abortive infection protein [Paracoccus zhejiangensis]AUH65151.1 hypothetical protein CX676_14015 [Paracoccus zhejiangensis]
MTEDDIVSWLSRKPAPIRRDGVLTKTEVAAATTAYLNNGLSLFDDALFLAAGNRVARAAALTVLGLEEIAKIPLLVNTFLRYEHGVEKEAWKAYWNAGGTHKRKQELILGYGQIVRAVMDGDPVHDRRLYRYYAPETVLENLDGFKQRNFYVDLRMDGIHAPSSEQEAVNAFDYLLTFGQERADSFRSWHVSETRSHDYLDMALGKKRERWTNSYKIDEVSADILYQAIAFSASQVPNYAAFYSYAENYKDKVADTRFKEALLVLGAALLRRVKASEPLPLYYARYIGAFKLMIGLSQEEKLLGKSFGRKLHSTLLPQQTKQSG